MEITEGDPEDLFDIEEKLGEGAYGIVCKCVHKKSGKVYAMKFIDTQGDEDKAVKKEVDILKRLDSDTVVRFGGCYKKGETLLIAMEFCDGGSVQDVVRIADRACSEDEISAICAEVVKGLNYLHSHHIMHRDVKAGNVLLTTNGRAKLADFGVSAPLASTLQRIKSVTGSPYWMAPEIISKSNEGYDNKADIWSLGITAIEMAEKEPPRFNIHFARVIFAIPRDPAPTLKNPSKHSPEFVDFITICLNKDPKLRPNSKQLLSHPFILRGAGKNQLIAKLVKETQPIIQERRAEMAQLEDEDGSSSTMVKGVATVEILSSDDSSNQSDTFRAEDLGAEENVIKGMDYKNVKTYV